MTEEEKQELNVLRMEKHQRTQQARAQAALKAAGVPTTFAAFLIGADDSDTDHRAEQFKAAYQAALAEDVRTRLPQQPPVVTTIAAPVRERRGVHRIR